MKRWPMLLFAAWLVAGSGVSASRAHEARSETAPLVLDACPDGCDDANPCTDDVCGPSGCSHTANSSPCSDGQACTTNDRCQAGVCVGGDTAQGCASCDAVATIPPGGGTFGGTTSGSGTLGSDCNSSLAAPERVYRFTPASSGTVTIDTCGSQTTYDTLLQLRGDACDAAQLACNDDACASGINGTDASRISYEVTAGRTYYIVVDGYLNGSGSYVLHVATPSTCGNGVREGSEQCDAPDGGACGSAGCTPSCTCAPTPALPDLVPTITDWFVQYAASVDPGDVAEGCAEAVSGVDLLRLGVLTRNLGNGDLFLGDPACPAPCTDHPLEICGNPNFICSPAGGHNHGHYLDYARYELLDATQQTVVVGHKQGFCLKDGQDAGPCPNAKFTCTYQGITTGCGDLYESALGCQYLDITGIPSGSYTLRVSIDPLDRIPEQDEANNVVTVTVTITRDACEEAIVLPPAGGTFTGTTSGPNTRAGSCGQTNLGPERVFQWTPGVSGTARIESCSTTATDFDTVLYVRAGSCTGTELGCNDDAPCPTANSVDEASRVEFSVSAGQTYFLFVDGYRGESGDFALHVIPPACLPAGAACDDANPCTTGDVCTDGACAGTPAAPPAEVNDSLRLARTPQDATLAWSDAPGPFNVYRGSTPAETPWTYNHACLAAGTTGPDIADPELPATSVLYWYLVTREGACGESIPGRQGDGTPIPPGAACP